jgi:hypothetical protein
MVMAGLIQHRIGLQVQVVWPMLGLKIPLNGMIPMAMVAATIHQVQLPTFVLLIRERQLDRVQAEIVGAVQILTVMVGQT